MDRNSSYRKWRVRIAAVLFVLAASPFLFGGGALARFMAVQLGPAVAKAFFAFSWGTLGIVAVIVAVTILFGRFYCAAFCPMGILQDGIGRITARKRAISVPNLPWLRYGVAAATGVLLVGGSALGLRLLDPFSNFGAIVAGQGSPLLGGEWPGWPWGIAGALLPLLAITIMVVWKKRLFCTALCPVGTLLGLCARHGTYRMRLEKSCVGCGACANVCPVDCIEPASRSLDNERCVRCMNCLAACPFGSIAFSRESPVAESTVNENIPADPSRRRFLMRGSLAAAGMVAAGMGAGRYIAPLVHDGREDRELMLPPGAMTIGDFSRECTSCQLCVAGCPAGIIKPAPARYGPVRVELGESGVCRYNCARCANVCPTGALKALTLDSKRRLRIGMASFNARACRVLQKREACGFCIHACPTGAITPRVLPSGLEIPVLNPGLCIGCGACQAVCPTSPKAMTVGPVAKQEFLPL